MISETEIIELYKNIYKGKLKRFPYGFYVKYSGDIDNIRITILKYIFIDMLNLNRNEAIITISNEFFKKYKIYNLMEYYTITTIKKLQFYIDSIYPTPKEFDWDTNCDIKFMSYYKEQAEKIEKLIKDNNYTDDFIINNFSYSFLTKHKILIPDSLEICMSMIKPYLKPWHYKHQSKSFWNDINNIKEYIKYVVDEYLDNLSEREFKMSSKKELICKFNKVKNFNKYVNFESILISRKLNLSMLMMEIYDLNILDIRKPNGFWNNPELVRKFFYNLAERYDICIKDIKPKHIKKEVCNYTKVIGPIQYIKDKYGYITPRKELII